MANSLFCGNLRSFCEDCVEFFHEITLGKKVIFRDSFVVFWIKTQFFFFKELAYQIPVIGFSFGVAAVVKRMH